MNESTFTWATVTAIGPLRIKLDGDTAQLPFTPEALVDTAALAVSDRVRVELSNNRPIIHDKVGGDGTTSRLLSAYVPRQTVYFTAGGTFSKATYPWLRAIRVRLVSGGGGGGGAATTAATQNAIGGSGGAGGFAESFITNIAGLSSSVTVAVGTGGAGGSAGANAGSAGGSSSFGALVAANGGSAGAAGTAFASGSIGAAQGVAGGSGTAGDLQVPGEGSQVALYSFAGIVVPAQPGVAPFFGGIGAQLATISGAAGAAGQGYGSGGQGGHNAQSQGTARAGGAGAPGLLILDLFD